MCYTRKQRVNPRKVYNMSIDLKSLIKSGVHFGHQTWRWNPKMAPYIWGQKNGVHLIDVSKTAHQMEKAAKFLEEVAASGKSVLWCGTKKAAAMVLPKVLQNVQPTLVTHRWIGGTITNWSQIKKSITKKMHYEDILAKADQSHYTKKELNVYGKVVERLDKNIGGLKNLTWPMGALVVVDVRKEHVAVKEALSVGIPIVALVDTNGDPSMIDYVIPANDDAPKSIEVVMQYLADAVQRGQAVAATVKVKEEVQAENTLEKMLEYALGSDDEGRKSEALAKRPARQPQRKPATSRARK